MKNFVFVSLLCVVLGIGINPSGAQVNNTILPDAEYSINFVSETGCRDSSDVHTLEIWVTSYAEHGITCAFVDFSTNLSVLGISHGEDYTVFNSGEIDDSGVTDLGGCSFTTNGNGLNPDWSLVAIVDLEDTQEQSDVWVFIGKPSHRALSTSIYGEGTARHVDYGESIRCAITNIPNLGSERRSESRKWRKQGVN